MKNKFYILFVFIISIVGYAQTGIGIYSTHDGGFENHSANLAGGTTLAANLSTTLWTANTTANIVRVFNATGGRSGPKFVSIGSVNGSVKNFYSPQIAGGFAPNTTYQIQFYYKSASTVALEASTVDIFTDNTTATQAPPIGTKQGIDAGLLTGVSSWTKVAVAITTNATAAGAFGVAGFTIDATASGYSADIDDFVVYQANSPDTTAPNSPGAITATGTAGNGANVSWGAASGGVDGGGYLVVRYDTTLPLASDDPNQNGIYKVGGTIGNGLVRFIGTGTSFSDTGLSPGINYYYKVYTLDKAFNYSNESTTSTPTQSIATTYYFKGTGVLTDLANWGLNTNGTGTAPANFTDASQVFEIRNTTAVTLDGVWTVGADPANGTKIRFGSNTQATITLTLNSGASIGPSGTGNFDVSAPLSGGQKVIYKGITAISFGNIFDSNLEVTYDAVTVSSSSTKSFGTISIINGAQLTLTATPVIKNIFVDATSTLVTPTSASSAFITIPSGGSVVIDGIIRVPKLSGFVSSGVGTPNDSFGALQFVGAENLSLGANSTVEYVRTAAGAQTVTARTDYKNLTLGGTTPKSFNGPSTVSGTLSVNQSTDITLLGDLTVNGTLAFTLGKITTGANTLIIGTSGTITGANQTTGWINGNLKKLTALNASPTFTYPIGDATNYSPLSLTFSGNTTVAGGLTAKINTGDHPQIATSLLNSTKSVNRNWTLTNDGIAGFGTYGAVFSYTSADVDSGSIPANYAVRLYNGTSWSTVTSTGTTTDTAATTTGITSFGEFAIGEFDPLSISDKNQSVFTVYPNPVNDGVLYVDSENNSEKSIEIYDSLGRKVFTAKSSNKVEIGSLKSGIYFAKIKADNDTSVKKIIVTKK